MYFIQIFCNFIFVYRDYAIIITIINYEIADTTVSCFADDTRILLGIKDEEDTQMLQNDLHKLYKWADTI